MTTLKLNNNWDLEVDSSGNIILVSGGYALAQQVANYIRAFKNDMFFDQNQGLDHFNLDITKRVNPSVIISAIENEALKVNGIKSAQCKLYRFENRILEGEVLLELTSGGEISLFI